MFTLISIKIMRIWIFFTRNRVLKHKEVVSNLHVFSNGLWKMWASYLFYFTTRIHNSTHTKLFNIFFSIIYVAMSNIHFSALYNVKMICKHISTKVSFKITIWKRLVYINIVWTWIWNHYFYLGIWIDHRTKIEFLPSFPFVTRLNSQNKN